MIMNQAPDLTSETILPKRVTNPPTGNSPKIFQCEVSVQGVLQALKDSAALRRKTGFCHHQRVLLCFEPGRLRVTSYSLDKGVSYSACLDLPECGSSVSLVVDAYALTAVLEKVKAPSVQIRVCQGQNTVDVIEDGKCIASLPKFPVLDYPVLALGPDRRFLASLSRKHMPEIWKKVGFCADKQVHWVFDGRQLHVIAANRFSMVRYSLPCVTPFPLEFTIPSQCLKTCALLEGPFRIEVAPYGVSDAGLVVFSSPSHQVIGRIMEGFPNYRAVCVSATKTLDFWIPNLREGFRQAVEWAKDLELPMTRMDLDLGKQFISLTTGDQTCQIPYACGTQLHPSSESLFVNPVLVDKALKGFPRKGKAHLSFEAPEKPIQLEAKAQALEVFISPIRPPKSS